MSETSGSEARLKVVIDKPACCGYGLCAEICPTVFKLDEHGMVYVDDPLVPEGLEAEAQEGADSCPQAALKLVPA